MTAYGKSFRIAVVVLFSLAAGGLLTGRAYSQTSTIKIGSVDIQRALNECDAGKEAKKALTKEVEKFQRLVAEKQKELQDMKESLEKQVMMLTPEARGTREKELQTRLRDVQRWGEDAQNEVNQRRAEMERNVLVGLQKVVQKLGADEGYTLILEKSQTSVLFASKSIDMTDLAIKAYDVQKK
ncbi:MAG: OmpH family outer membrane protein [Thermodesulfobacteriota bacterium]|jgi:outer membrane protein